MAIYDRAILEAALVGLTQKKREIDEIIKKLRGSGSSAIPTSLGPTHRHSNKRVMSRAARKRIAEAQKKRWASWRKEKTETAN